MQEKVIAFIGAGNMGGSLIGGLLANGYQPQKIWASNNDESLRTELTKRFQIAVTANNRIAAQAADIIVLSVKPQIMSMVVTEIADIILAKKSLVISIAAGVRVQRINQWLGGQAAIVRCMPNIPATVRCGVTALFANAIVDDSQKKLADNILQAVGVTVWLPAEEQLDAVTAVSGSGPAYFFLLMEIMEQAAIQLGLDAKIARVLTQQTCLGAARMALESGESVADLRQRVTSPGGTTEKALAILQAGKINDLVISALKAAQLRAAELASETNLKS